MPKTATKPELVGLAEAAEIVGISRATLSARRRGEGVPWRPGDDLPQQFPEPVAELRCGPVWKRADIANYARDVERRAKMSWVERYDEDKRREKRPAKRLSRG